VNTPGIVARSLRGYNIVGRAHRPDRYAAMTSRAVLTDQIVTPESPVFTGSLASARVHGLEHAVLDVVGDRCALPDDAAAGARAGAVRGERRLRPSGGDGAGQRRPRQAGGDLRFSEPVTR
jgi:hypothetical protein